LSKTLAKNRSLLAAIYIFTHISCFLVISNFEFVVNFESFVPLRRPTVFNFSGHFRAVQTLTFVSIRFPIQ